MSLQAEPPEPLALTGARIDRVAGRVFGRTGVHPLTRAEAALLERLFADRGHAVDRDTLLRDPALDPRSLDQLVRRLRQKIETDPGRPENLITVRGEGYKLVSGPTPTARDRVFGRTALQSAVAGALAPGAVVTLSGPPGVGKTRLAQAVVELVRLAWEPVRWVELAPARDADSALAAVAAVLEVELGDEPAAARVGRALAALGPCLVVLDNTEQIAEIGRVVCELGARAPHATFLATSRDRVGVAGERVHEVPPLPTSCAVALFRERAADARGAELVGADHDLELLMTALDGLPLAIELAASRAAIASPRAIRERIERSLGFLQSSMRDAPPRHLTLEAAFESSWELLDPGDRRVLAGSTVFAERFSAEDVARVLDVADAAQALDRLARRHLLRVEDGRYHHYAVLGPFARDRLPPTDADRAHHAERFARYGGLASWNHPRPATDLTVLWQIRRDLPEIRRAAGWAIGAGQVRTAIDAALALTLLELLDGVVGALDPAERTLALVGGDPVARWDLEARVVWLTHFHGARVDQTERMERLIATAPDRGRALIAKARRLRAGRLSDAGRWFAEAVEVCAEAERLGDPAVAAIAHTTCAVRGYDDARAEVAAVHSARAVELRRALGDRRGLATELHLLYSLRMAVLDYPGAAALEPEIDALNAETGHARNTAHTRFDRGRRLMEHGDPHEAERAFLDGRALLDRLGDSRRGHEPRIYIAAIRANLDRLGDAIRLADEVERDAPALALIARLLRGGFRVEAGDPEGALADLDTSGLWNTRGNPLKARFDGARAAALARLGRVEESQTLLAAAVEAGATDRMSAAVLAVYGLDVATAAGDRGAAAAAMASTTAVIRAAELTPTSSLAAMLRRR